MIEGYIPLATFAITEENDAVLEKIDAPFLYTLKATEVGKASAKRREPTHRQTRVRRWAVPGGWQDAESSYPATDQYL